VKARILHVQDTEQLKREIQLIGADKSAADKLAPKFSNIVIKVKDLSLTTCRTLKKISASVGAAAIHAEEDVPDKQTRCDLLILGNISQLKNIAEKIEHQNAKLCALSRDIKEIISSLKSYTNFVLDLPRHKLNLYSKIHISGVVNVTPDSFSDGGLYFDRERAIERAHQIVEEGADIIDIGGESTRPGSEPIPAKEELRRVMPVIERLNLDIPISIDTYKAEVAREALSAGCELVNDISGLRFDPDMANVIKEFDAGCIVMHIKGTPKDMQINPTYDDVMYEIITYLKESIETARRAGIPEEKILVDPGIGFGKRNPSDNLLILKRLAELKVLGRPIHIGVSRKSFIGKSLGLPLEERLEPSIASGILAALNGANVLRVHDVKATVKAIRMIEAIQRA